MASSSASLCSMQDDGISSISGATLQKARKELREVPEKRSECVRQLRKAIEAYRRQPGEEDVVFQRTDGKFLLMFLRARKFDVDRALQVYVNYYKYRHKHSYLFARKSQASLDRIARSGVFGVLPSPLKDGSRAVCLHPSRWDVSTMEPHDCCSVFLSVLDKLLEDEEVQVHGISFIDNAEGCPLQKLYHFIRTDTWRLGVDLQDAFPARFKGLHFINQPWYVSFVMSVVKPLLKQKHKDRFHAHGTNMESFYEHVDPENLYSDFGGYLPPMGQENLTKFLRQKSSSGAS